MVMVIHGKEILFVLEIIFLILSYVVAAVPPKFGYTGSIGPSNWGKLSPDYSLCSTGTLQSPINITDDEATKYDSSLESLDRDYVNSNATLINNGFNVEVRFEQDIGEVLIGGKKYSLLQIHWHSPAEHTINGKRYPVELHLVHKTQDGASTAVIALLYEYGRPDPFLNQLKDSLDKLEPESLRNGDEAAQLIGTGVVNTKALSRDKSKYYRYFGSLTAPPCTETVIWNILAKVKQISREQVAALKAPLRIDSRDNSRPLQPLNARTVNLYHAAAAARQ